MLEQARRPAQPIKLCLVFAITAQLPWHIRHGGRQQDVVLAEQGGGVARDGIAHVEGGDEIDGRHRLPVLVAGQGGRFQRIERHAAPALPRQGVYPRHQVGAPDAGIGMHEGWPRHAQRGRCFFHVVAQAFQQAHGVLQGGIDGRHGMGAIAGHALHADAQPARRHVHLRQPGDIGRMRHIGFTCHHALHAVEQGGAVAHRAAHAQLHAQAAEDLVHGGAIRDPAPARFQAEQARRCGRHADGTCRVRRMGQGYDARRHGRRRAAAGAARAQADVPRVARGAI